MPESNEHTIFGWKSQKGMKIFTTKQIASIDRYTIEHEPIADIDLMERAAQKMTGHLVNLFPGEQPLVFFSGTGNNGGDALAMARLFAAKRHPCTVFYPETGRPLSPSCSKNLERLREQGLAILLPISSEADFPVLNPGTPVIEGLFGAGLTRPLEGLPAALVRHINQSGARVYAIDMPAGLMGEDNGGNPAENIIRAAETLTLQFPKISLLFPENEIFTGRVTVIDIGLHPGAIAGTETPFRITERREIRALFPPRKRFSHKGTYGHALLVAGSYGKTGAAVLAAQACQRSGAGLVTVHIPRCGYSILQTASPETMCSTDPADDIITTIPELAAAAGGAKYSAIGAGPGLGTHAGTRKALFELLGKACQPLVLDADALNILSEKPALLQEIPPGSVLTPHPGEFRRLFGDDETTVVPGMTAIPGRPNEPGRAHNPGQPNSWLRLEKQRRLSQTLGVVIVLKGAFTTITLPSGDAIFNPTGNPGMATGGSGDVLTGIITALLAQRFSPEDGAIAGVYIHGLAGDLAARSIPAPALIASDIIRFLPKTFRKIYGFIQ